MIDELQELEKMKQINPSKDLKIGHAFLVFLITEENYFPKDSCYSLAK